MQPMFDLPRTFVEPAVRMLRAANTLLDAAFYDVNVLSDDLRSRGEAIGTSARKTGAAADARFRAALRDVDLGALSDPEGAILVVDTNEAPYITTFRDVPAFVAHANKNHTLRSLSITGVGSSALGSAAFAWNISAATGEPVAAIVPGYGLADVVQQALGGWFMGMHAWALKQASQEALARSAPELAEIGRGLLKTVPRHATLNGATVFTHGSGSADVLCAVLAEAPNVARLYGHSKGALVIETALDNPHTDKTRTLQVTTFGCPIEKALPNANYEQYLGLLDWLGALNAWGNLPRKFPLAGHSTNTRLPLSLEVAHLARAPDARQPSSRAADATRMRPVLLPNET